MYVCMKYRLFGQENGVLEKYKLAPAGVEQARLAGDLFRKVITNKPS